MQRAILVLVWVFGGFASTAYAQAPEAEEEVVEEIELVTEVTEIEPTRLFESPKHSRTDRTVNMFTARPTRQRSLLLVIDHRAYDSLFTTDVGKDYLGFDAGSDTYEFDARWRFLRQERHVVDVALRAGVSWFVVPDASDDAGFAAQLLVDRVFADRVLVQGGISVSQPVSERPHPRIPEHSRVQSLNFHRLIGVQGMK